MWRFKPACRTITLLCWVLIASCGYQWTSAPPFDLPEGVNQLYLQEVINPTTQDWIEPEMRTALREEFRKRGKVQWVDRAASQARLKVQILSYSTAAKLEDVQEETIKSQVILKFKATIIKSQNNEELWHSGELEVRRSYSGEDTAWQRRAEQEVMELAAERLADKLSQNF